MMEARPLSSSRRHAFSLAAALLLLAACNGHSEQIDLIDSEAYRVRVKTVISGLERPWGMAFLPGGGMLITEHGGRLRRVENGRLVPDPVRGLPQVRQRGQGGLMDVALHPRFEDNRWVYLSYTAAGEGGYGTEVARGKLNDNTLTDMQVIFRALPKVGGGRHFGSRLLFAPDGRLFITLGERGRRELAQDTTAHPGSLIRLDADGSVPADNPFVDRSGVRPEIYSYGHRNIQGIARQPGADRIWTHEHGPQGGDELNLIRAGANYGWPVITYGKNYVTGTDIGEGTHKAGMEQPRHYWVPSIAPSGMAFYTGPEFPHWQGDVFVGSLKFGVLVRLDMEGDRVVREERLGSGRLGRIRDVRQGPDGGLYLLEEAGGRLLRLVNDERVR